LARLDVFWLALLWNRPLFFTATATEHHLLFYPWVPDPDIGYKAFVGGIVILHDDVHGWRFLTAFTPRLWFAPYTEEFIMGIHRPCSSCGTYTARTLPRLGRRPLHVTRAPCQTKKTPLLAPIRDDVRKVQAPILFTHVARQNDYPHPSKTRELLLDTFDQDVAQSPLLPKEYSKMHTSVLLWLRMLFSPASEIVKPIFF
jgi:hypothetical protein